MQGFLFWSRSPALEQIRTIISRLGGIVGQEGQIAGLYYLRGKKGRVFRNVAVSNCGNFAKRRHPFLIRRFLPNQTDR